VCTHAAVVRRKRRDATGYVAAAIVSVGSMLSTRGASAQDTLVARIRGAMERDDARRTLLIDSLGPEMRRLASMYWTIPEYHDEQRLLDGSGGFGPVANIYASPMLDGFTEEWQIAAQGPPGVLVAIVVVDPPAGGGTTLPPTYVNLSLTVGINCLWLSYTPNAPPHDQWKGHIGPATASRECDRNSTTVHDLAVDRETNVNHRGHDDYPPVGRFSETTTEQPLLGTACIKAWCNYGPPTGFTSRPPGGGDTGREDRVRGWHDEQRLEEPGAGGVRPGPRAVVIPMPNVNNHPESDFDRGWVKVARIVIVDPLPATSKYYKAGLRTGRNLLELRRVGSVYQAQVTAGGGAPQRLPYVDPQMHYDAAVPATARWRHTTYDDGVWVPCGPKCCRAQF